MRLLKHFVVAAFFVTLLMSGCSTKFSVTAPWKDITVVYGIMNVNDTAHYVKINKAYLNATTSALKIAQIPDSLYYPSLNVVLQQTDGYNNVINIPLTRVDGNLEGYPKDYGTFAQSPNYLYKTTQALYTYDSYQLVITKPNNQQVTASTNIIGNLQVAQPNSTEKVGMFPTANSNYNVNWTQAANAYFYGLSIRFHYIEYPSNSPTDTTQKYFDWQVFTNYLPDTTRALQTYPISTIELYLEMVDNIPVNPSVTRQVRWLDFTFAAGGQPLYTYFNVAFAQSGLTQGEIEPTYTNINNGIGIFSTRVFSLIPGVYFQPTTIDSIACTGLTHNLNFLNSQGQLCQ